MTAFAVSTKMFPYLIMWLHFYGLNYYYAAVALAMTLWGWTKIEATDDLSLIEIEQLYDCRSVKLKQSDNYGSTHVQQGDGRVSTARRDE